MSMAKTRSMNRFSNDMPISTRLFFATRFTAESPASAR